MFPDKGTFQVEISRRHDDQPMVTVLPSCLAVVASVPFDEPRGGQKCTNFCTKKIIYHESNIYDANDESVFLNTYHVEIENKHNFGLI